MRAPFLISSHHTGQDEHEQLDIDNIKLDYIHLNKYAQLITFIQVFSRSIKLKIRGY